jgi:hypothetical protein
VVLVAGKEHGISPETMRRAKTALKAAAIKNGTQWYWVLPTNDGGQGSQDSHDFS